MQSKRIMTNLIQFLWFEWFMRTTNGLMDNNTWNQSLIISTLWFYWKDILHKIKKLKIISILRQSNLQYFTITIVRAFFTRNYLTTMYFDKKNYKNWQIDKNFKGMLQYISGFWQLCMSSASNWIPYSCGLRRFGHQSSDKLNWIFIYHSQS